MITNQEKFWSGSFGNAYSRRVNSKKLIKSNQFLFKRILSKTRYVTSIMELGCNIGLNLIAIKNISKKYKLNGLEINKKAYKIAQKNLKTASIVNETIFKFNSDQKFDFVFTKGVLIHLNPNKLNQAYQKIYDLSKKYILIAEYYNPYPIKIKYRGHDNKLFKRDFADEIMKKYKDLKLIDYGFVYRNDSHHPQDDINWFLLKKI